MSRIDGARVTTLNDGTVCIEDKRDRTQEIVVRRRVGDPGLFVHRISHTDWFSGHAVQLTLREAAALALELTRLVTQIDKEMTEGKK
jgi:hypothetical protein